MAVVMVLGAALHPIDRAVQKNDLKYVQCGSLGAAKLERRPAGSATVVASVIITFTEGKP